MTRARDFLVVALPAKTGGCPLFAELGAPWLGGGEGRKSLALPGGTSIPYMRRAYDRPDAVQPPVEHASALRWFANAGTRTDRPPAVVVASAAAAASCRLIETQIVGTRVALSAATDMAALGSAVHACFAAALSGSEAGFNATGTTRILQRFGVDGVIAPAALSRQMGRLERWIAGRWPNCRRHPEIPIEAVLPNGQIVQGRIDLLLEVDGGWILIDHKSNPAPRGRWDEVAAEHSGQLATYADALERATNRPVKEIWILLPIAAGAIRISVNASAA
jgi:hypothetical protein